MVFILINSILEVTLFQANNSLFRGKRMRIFEGK